MARFRFSFWLDAQKDDELLLMEAIDELKSVRKFTQAVRNGIRLFVDLSNGKTDVLEELFPDVVAKLQRQESPAEQALREQLARIEQQLIQQGNRPVPMPAASGGPQQIETRQFDLPTFDDEDDDFAALLVPAKPRKVDVAANFMESVRGLLG